MCVYVSMCATRQLLMLQTRNNTAFCFGFQSSLSPFLFPASAIACSALWHFYFVFILSPSLSFALTKHVSLSCSSLPPPYHLYLFFSSLLSPPLLFNFCLQFRYASIVHKISVAPKPIDTEWFPISI